MPAHATATREEWLAARRTLLSAEKELTRRGDDIAQQRQDLPWVRVDAKYTFETDEGAASLDELFRGRSQLMVYHFMFGPDFEAGCQSCSSIADGFNGFAVHLANHDVMLWAVSRAPQVKLQTYKRRMGWTFPWASSYGSDFNADFAVASNQDQQRAGVSEYNFGPYDLSIPEGAESGPLADWAGESGTDWATYAQERPGLSTFVLDDGVVYHTYSTYARGLDGLWGTYQWLDRAPRGRNEDRGPSDRLNWFRRNDEYDDQAQHSHCC